MPQSSSVEMASRRSIAVLATSAAGAGIATSPHILQLQAAETSPGSSVVPCTDAVEVRSAAVPKSGQTGWVYAAWSDHIHGYPLRRQFEVEPGWKRWVLCRSQLRGPRAQRAPHPFFHQRVRVLKRNLGPVHGSPGAVLVELEPKELLGRCTR